MSKKILTVFISSTSYDLKDYRTEVEDAILQIEMHPINMEHFGSESGGSVETSLRNVRKADIYLGIIAQRYGYVPDYQEKSVTEQEYDEAVRLSKPRLIYLLEPNYSWPKDRIELDEIAQKRLEAFVAKVTKNNALTWFTTQDDLSKKVTAGLVKEKERQEQLIKTRQLKTRVSLIFSIFLVSVILWAIYGFAIKSQGVTNNSSASIDCTSTHKSTFPVNSFGLVADQFLPAKYLTIRDTPSLKGKEIGLLEASEVFRILSTSECNEGQMWLKVDVGGNTSGWIIEQQKTDTNYIYLVQPINLAPQLSTSTPCRFPFFFGSAIGCPENSETSVSGAYQEYEHGFMIWSSQPDEVYAFSNDHSVFIIIKSVLEKLPDNPIHEDVPANLYRPTSGFGRVWGNFDKIRNLLGWAKSPEQSYSLTTQSIDLSSTPPEDKIIRYLQLPTNQIVAVGVKQDLFWRFAK